MESLPLPVEFDVTGRSRDGADNAFHDIQLHDIQLHDIQLHDIQLHDIQLHGIQLHCRLPTLADIDHIVEACQDPEIARWTTVPSPYGPEEGRGFVEFCAAQWGNRTGLHTIIVPNENSPLAHLPLVGAVGADIDWETDEAAIGYWIHRDARRHGVASTAAGGLCQWLLDIGIRRIHAAVLSGNEGSAATLQKLGFSHEGTYRSRAAGRCGVGLDRMDELVFGLLPGEFISPLG